MKVLRVYHAGRNPEHRKRDIALASLGVQVTLVVPSFWEDSDSEPVAVEPSLNIIELPVVRPGAVNAHRHYSSRQVRDLLRDLKPDLLDLHEEPFSRVAHQWLSAADRELPAVLYTAQNLDKRFPPPFNIWERTALKRCAGMYPCSRQAASVARGKGHAGRISVLPLGLDPSVFRPSERKPRSETITLGIVGRLVPEKGIFDAINVVSRLRAKHDVRLVVVGSGKSEGQLRELVAARSLTHNIDFHRWSSPDKLAGLYREMDYLLAPSRTTGNWVEQYGRMIAEAQACGAVPIAYATGSIPEVVSNAGIVVSEGDIDAMARAIADLAVDQQRAELLRCAGFELAGRRSWQTVAAGMLKLYASVLEGANVASSIGRAAARLEFGTPAETGNSRRPIAVPGFIRLG